MRELGIVSVVARTVAKGRGRNNGCPVSSISLHCVGLEYSGVFNRKF